MRANEEARGAFVREIQELGAFLAEMMEKVTDAMNLSSDASANNPLLDSLMRSRDLQERIQVLSRCEELTSASRILLMHKHLHNLL